MASYSSEVSTGGSQKDSGNLAKEIDDIFDKKKEEMAKIRKNIEKMLEILKSVKVDEQKITARSEDSIESVDERTHSTVRSQVEKHSPKLEEKKDKISKCMKEELHNEELHSLYRSPNIVRVIKSRRLRWAGHVARMEEGRSAFKIVTGVPIVERPLGRPRRGWEDNNSNGS